MLPYHVSVKGDICKKKMVKRWVILVVPMCGPFVRNLIPIEMLLPSQSNPSSMHYTNVQTPWTKGNLWRGRARNSLLETCGIFFRCGHWYARCSCLYYVSYISNTPNRCISLVICKLYKSLHLIGRLGWNGVGVGNRSGLSLLALESPDVPTSEISIRAM